MNAGECDAECSVAYEDCMTSVEDVCDGGRVCDGEGNCEWEKTSGACAEGQCNSTWVEGDPVDGTCHYLEGFTDDCVYSSCGLNETAACTTAGCVCQTDAYCDDGDPCTIDECVNHGTVYADCSHTKREVDETPDQTLDAADGCCLPDSNGTWDVDCGTQGEGESWCPGYGFVDLQTDEDHCGACTTNCTASKACCSGSCVNLAVNEENCGGCGVDCGVGEFCDEGECVLISCDEDSDCDDSNNCTVNACANPGTGDARCTTTAKECGTTCECDGDDCFCDGEGNCTTQGIAGANCIEQCFPAFEMNSTCFYDVEFGDDCVYESCNLTAETVCTEFGCACTTHSACDDGNPCTTDTCVEGICEHESKTCGTACPDGVCVESECVERKSEGESCVCEECEDGMTCEGGVCTIIAGCGNGQCDPGECSRCPRDCMPEDCRGDGVCSSQMDEDCENAPEDCQCAAGKCEPDNERADEKGCVSSWCGDGICSSETRECALCAEDCSIEDCEGNGKCDALVGENCENSPDCSCDLQLETQTEEIKLEKDEKKSVSFKVRNMGNAKQSFNVTLGGNLELAWRDARVELEPGQEAVMTVEVWSEKGGLHFLEIGMEDDYGNNTRTAVPFDIESEGEVEKAKSAFDFILWLKDSLELVFLAAAALGGLIIYVRQKSQNPQDYRVQSQASWTNPNQYGPGYPATQQPPEPPSNSPDFPTFRRKR